MHYYENGEYIGVSAHSLRELRDTVLLASPESIGFHMSSGHFEDWIRLTIGDKTLADDVKALKSRGFSLEELQQKLHKVVADRVDELSPD